MGSPTPRHSSRRRGGAISASRGIDPRSANTATGCPGCRTRSSSTYLTRAHDARGAAPMSHPLFRKEMFIETAFERRFQAMLRSAWHKQSWHVIVADPGAGKTMGIRDLVRTAGAKVVLAVTAPKNNEEELALGNQLFSALGLPLRGRWSDRKPKLMGYL